MNNEVAYEYENEQDWTYDLTDPNVNFFYHCVLCNVRFNNGPKNGRLGAALCPKCWVFLQGYYWFHQVKPQNRPRPEY